MALPIIIAAAIALLLAAGTIKINWDKLLVLFKGKRVAVLGARAVGKTQLLNFLSTETIPKEYKQTLGTEKIDGNRYKLSELDLKLKRTKDVSGSKDAYGEWKKLFDEADIVFYLLRADLLIMNDEATEARVKDDIAQISRWLKECDDEKILVIAGTHCDLDPNYKKVSPQTAGNYLDKFNDLDIVNNIAGRVRTAEKLVIWAGSMKNKESTELFVYSIFSKVST